MDVAGSIQVSSNLILGNNTANFRGIKIQKNPNGIAPYNVITNIATNIPGCSNSSNLTTVYSDFLVSSNLILTNTMKMRGLYIQKNSNVNATPYNVTSMISSITGFSNSNDISSVYASNYVNIMASNVEVIRFNSNGYVGIGMSNPAYPLDVTGTVNISPVGIGAGRNKTLVIRDFNSNESLDTGSNFHGFGSGSYFFRYQTPATNYHRWFTGSTNTMTLNPNGNLGIGTTEPAYHLDVAGIINTSSYIRTGSGGTTNTNNYPGVFIGAANTQNAVIVGDIFQKTGFTMGLDQSTSTFKLQVGGGLGTGNFTATPNISVSNNNVGIGTANPTTKLDVAGTINTQGITYSSASYTNTSNYSGITANTWYTVIPAGALSTGAPYGTYIVNILFTQTGAPYQLGGSFLHFAINTNDGSTIPSTSGATIPTSVHAPNGATTNWQLMVRGISGSAGYSSGLQLSIASALTPTSGTVTLTINAYRLV